MPVKVAKPVTPRLAADVATISSFESDQQSRIDTC